MPTPESVTRTSTQSSRADKSTPICRDCPEYFIALSSRFTKTCVIACTSTRTAGSRASGQLTEIVKPSRSRRASTALIAAVTTSSIAVSSRRYRVSTDSMRAKSRTLSIRCRRRSLSCSIRLPYSTTFSSDLTRPRRRNSPNSASDATGVRSSCDTLATNAFLIRARRRSLPVARHVSSTPPRTAIDIRTVSTQLVNAFDARTCVASV